MSHLMQGHELSIPIRWLGPNPPTLPHYQTIGSAGMDLHAVLKEDIVLQPRKRTLVPTGIAIALPLGYEAQVRPRSGLALKHGITLLNSPGTIDSDYRGEIKAILINHGEEAYTISPGERIAQLVIAPVVQARWDLQEELPSTQRNAGGFGSTSS